MDLINIQVSPTEYFQLGKFKISEGIKCLKDFVERYNSKLEMVGMVDEIMNYMQSLHRDLQDIESSVQRGQPDMSSNLNGMDLHHGQEITQQNTYFEPTQNQESEMVVNSSVESLSGTKKRKLKSKVWEDFTKYIGEDKKEWAKCKHCKKKFVGSSKSGTTHLKNHLQSCPSLKNPNVVVDKVKEKSVIGLDLNNSDLVRKIIKCGLNGIKDNIFVVYKQEKCKFRGYINKLPSHFSVTIERLAWNSSQHWFMRIWFVDDSWELRNRIIFVTKCKDNYEDEDEDEDEDENEDEYDYCEILKSLLVDWNMHKKICYMFISDGEGYEKVTKNLNNWFNKQSSLPFIGTIISSYDLLNIFHLDSFDDLKEISHIKIIAKASKLLDYVCTPSHGHKLKCAAEKVLSMGKIVTSQSVPHPWDNSIKVLEWVMGCKEVFNELEHIDLDFKSINFTKEDWDDATLLYSGWEELQDLEEEIDSLTTLYRTVNVNFQIVRNIFSKLVQWEKSDNYYICHIASHLKEGLAEYWKNSRSVLEVVLILDPRCKLEMAGHIYKMIYDNDFEIQLQKTIDDVTNIFHKYVKGTSSSSSTHGYSALPESEFSCYLRDKEHSQDENFDILKWWCDKSPIYPTLARMARDFLSIPVKIPYFDSYLMDVIRDYLDDDFKSTLACTKNWSNFF